MRFEKAGVIVLLLIGLTISGIRARQDAVEWPEDLSAFMLGFLSAEKHQNPYDLENCRRIAGEDEITCTHFWKYVYTPAFLPALEPLRWLSPANYRRLWQYVSLLSCWIGVYLLVRMLPKGQWQLPLSAVLVVLLAYNGPIISNFHWGQVTGFMFLGLCIGISRKMKGVVAGLSLSLLPLTKIGMVLPLLGLRGKKA